MPLLSDLRGCALRNQRDAQARWFPRRHRSAPWLAKLLALAVVAYALI